MHDVVKKRFYAHGDLHEQQPNSYYCAKCDAFVPLLHFDDPSHTEKRQEIYLKSLSALKSCKSYFRQQNAINIITPHTSADTNSQSTFFKWLLCQLKRDDIIGDLAKDVNQDSQFPKKPIRKNRFTRI